MFKIYLIRHGKTKGNLEGRYVGSTDEEILDEIKNRQKRKFPDVQEVYVSPMKRCRQTATLLFPGHDQMVVEDFRECNFGDFEYKNYAELNGNPEYQKFIDTMGMSGFPNGENRLEFQKRCVRAFETVIKNLCGEEKELPDKTIAMVVHGGTIMALLDYYAAPHKDYYEWQVKNMEGYEVLLNKEENQLLFIVHDRYAGFEIPDGEEL